MHVGLIFKGIWMDFNTFSIDFERNLNAYWMHVGLIFKGIWMHIECILAWFSKEFEWISIHVQLIFKGYGGCVLYVGQIISLTSGLIYAVSTTLVWLDLIDADESKRTPTVIANQLGAPVSRRPPMLQIPHTLLVQAGGLLGCGKVFLLCFLLGSPFFLNASPALFYWFLLCFLMDPLVFLMDPPSYFSCVSPCFLMHPLHYSIGFSFVFWWTPVPLAFKCIPCILLLASPLFFDGLRFPLLLMHPLHSSIGFSFVFWWIPLVFLWPPFIILSVFACFLMDRPWDVV